MNSSRLEPEVSNATGVGSVLLLHGHGRSGRSMSRLSASLRSAGYRTFAPSYGRLGRSMRDIVAHLLPQLTAFETEADGPLHLVTHSLGGLVARALLHAHRPDRLGRVVMLASPHGGSELADLLYRIRLNQLILGPIGSHLRTQRLVADETMLGSVDYELGVIAGDRALDPIFPRLILPRPNDGKVSVSATRVPGMRDHIVLPVTHTLMIYHRRVAAETIAFLSAGRFNDGDPPRPVNRGEDACGQV